MFTIRKTEERDRERILVITRDVGVFTEVDVGCVEELLAVYLYEPQKHEYYFLSAVDEGDYVLGYVCYGPTPLTEGTFDLYWLAVARAAQGQGIANALFAQSEEDILALGGRLAVLETSGTPEYAPARRMYERRGYTGRIAVPDFYRPGDDMVMFSKPLR